jgi:hypothetical protein
MKRLLTLLPLALVSLLFASGCATVTKGPNQRVEINSTPTGATVKINGEEAGTTPMTAKLSRKRAHLVELEKNHFRPQAVELLTVANSASDAFIRFGIDELIGAHTDLTPGDIHIELDPVILPTEVGENPVSDLAIMIVDLDDQLTAGEMKPEDHRYIMKRLFRFYED